MDVVNHLFGVGIGEGISFAETLDCYSRHMFQAQLLRQPFLVAVRSLPLFIGGTKWHFPGTEWQRDRKARQNVWDPLLKTNLTKYLKFHGINRTYE